ncbi:MAG: hypothetical protein V1692_02880, partial [bacterium]
MKNQKQNIRLILGVLTSTGFLALIGMIIIYGFSIDFLAILTAKLVKQEATPPISIDLPNNSPAGGEDQDYWLFIRTYDRYSFDQEKTAGRSKKGDIIDIKPVIP